MECKRAQNLIDAYFDEELDPLHAMELEAHVQECVRCTTVLNDHKALRQVLRAKLPYYKAPDSLRRRITGNAPRPWRRMAFAMAACFVLAVGGLSWSIMMRSSGHDANPSIQLADAIESDHVRSLLNLDHLTDVLSTDKHTVKPWFAGKLSFVPPVADLASDGFPLIGGRLDVIEHQTIAALVYKKDKHIINLFVWPSSIAAAPNLAATTARGYHIIHWTINGMEFWAVSDVESKELAHFADLQSAAPTTNH
jgi:anti-sigma factor RsiW